MSARDAPRLFMEIIYCDLCQQAVPREDLDRQLASTHGHRIVCRACNEAMGGIVGPFPGPPPAPQHYGPPGDPQATSSPLAFRVAGAPRSRFGPGVAIALSMAAILLTLVAVVALLVRVEIISDQWDGKFEITAGELENLHEREFGTRDFMVAQAGQVAEEVLQGELARLETIERQLGELRQILLTPRGATAGEESPEEGPETVLVDTSLVTAGDAMARVQELEEQILFLQARVYELLEGELVAPREGEEPLADQAPVLPGTVGELVARLKSEDPIERAIGLFGISTIEDPGIVRHVIPLLEDSDVALRVLAARSLERAGARSAGQALINALEDPDPSARQAAISALRAITGQQFLFDPRGTRDERDRATRKWRVWWSANWREFLYAER